jgi:hypothetical protein
MFFDHIELVTGDIANIVILVSLGPVEEWLIIPRLLCTTIRLPLLPTRTVSSALAAGPDENSLLVVVAVGVFGLARTRVVDRVSARFCEGFVIPPARAPVARRLEPFAGQVLSLSRCCGATPRPQLGGAGFGVALLHSDCPAEVAALDLSTPVFIRLCCSPRLSAKCSCLLRSSPNSSSLLFSSLSFASFGSGHR